MATGTFDDDLVWGDEVLEAVGPHNVYVARLSTAGELLWVHTAACLDDAGSGAITCDAAAALAYGDDAIVGGTYVGRLQFEAETTTALTYHDLWLARFGADGEVWATSIGGTAEDAVRALALDPTGRLVIAGWAIDPFLVDGQATLRPGRFNAALLWMNP